METSESDHPQSGERFLEAPRFITAAGRPPLRQHVASPLKPGLRRDHVAASELLLVASVLSQCGQLRSDAHCSLHLDELLLAVAVPERNRHEVTRSRGHAW